MNKTASAACALALGAHLGFSATLPGSFHFDFGSPRGPGRTLVPSTTLYSKELGYGFEPAAELANPAATGSFYNRAQPLSALLFSVGLAEGNYDVTLTFGRNSEAATNTIKAESRRLMLEEVITAPGQIQTRTFTVNIRTPRILGDGTVRLKEREKGSLDWDDKLTLEFNGTRPGVCAVDIAPDTNATTVFLLGDSTVTDQPREPWNSWGQMLPRFFKPGVAVSNQAESGESLKSSLGARRVAKVLAALKPGDYVFVQFGHNDQKDRATNALASYESHLRQLVADLRALGGQPVLVTSMERMAGVDHDTLGEYPATVAKVAREQNVPLIDLHALSRRLYRALGPNLKRAFQDGTHHNAYGSYELAKCVVEGLRQNHLDLARLITDDFDSFDPAHPDPIDQFRIPASPSYDPQKPEGN